MLLRLTRFKPHNLVLPVAGVTNRVALCLGFIRGALGGDLRRRERKSLGREYVSDAARSGGGTRAPATRWDFRWFWVVIVLCAIGVGSTLIYTSQVPSGVRWSVFGTALALSAAAFLAGGILGFLFGIPHTVQGSTSSTGEVQYQGNTNLEQVSDWLTKIIIGVGLVQIGRALPALSKLASNLKAPLGGQASSAAFGLGTAISYALLGFFFVYLWSRVVFTLQLNREAIRQLIDKRDSDRLNALMLVARQLYSLKGGMPPTQDELNMTVANVADATRLEIFELADKVRKENWLEDEDKPVMALSIPVFQALVATEGNEKLHRTHGSLGWALKDKKNPDWQKAIEELTIAITIRQKRDVVGWKLYEANRALCGIKLIDELPAGDPSIASLTIMIKQDLETALKERYAREKMIVRNQDIQRWLQDQEIAQK